MLAEAISAHVHGPGPLAPLVAVPVGRCPGALDSAVLTPSVVDPHTCPGSQANDILGFGCLRHLPIHSCSPLCDRGDADFGLRGAIIAIMKDIVCRHEEKPRLHEVC